MSLHQLAKQVQSKGRGNDKMLMHVTPREVAGLQAIAKANGGSLTVNPDTGLVEAGFLDNILPMVIGAGLTVASGGALTPLMAAGITGAGYGLATGSVEKGLMAGLGAYGGAGLGAGLTSAGASSIAEAGGSAAVDQLGSQATSLSADQLGNLSAEQLQGLKSVSDSGMYNTADVLKTANAANTQVGAQNLIGANNFPNLNASQLQAYGDTLSSGAYNPTDVIRSAGAQNATAGASGMQTAGAGFNQLGSEAGRSAVYNALPTGTLPSAGMSLAAGALEPKPYEEPEKRKYSGYTLSPDFQGYTPPTPNPYYRPTGLGYAAGGLTQMAPGGLAALQSARDGYGALETPDGNIPQFQAGKMVPKPKKATRTSAAQLAAMSADEAAMAQLNNTRANANMSQMRMPKAGVAELGSLPYATGGMASGRYLRGGGDGMSDSIPATINGKQPARLADGEFVIPADVVSHLGNGSSDAGAKRLYKMMDKVRIARTGKKKQAPAVKPEKYMMA
jgi:hypothetical protein